MNPSLPNSNKNLNKEKPGDDNATSRSSNQQEHMMRMLLPLFFGLTTSLTCAMPVKIALSQIVQPTWKPTRLGSAMAQYTALGALGEFLINPICGHYADGAGRRSMMLQTLLGSALFRVCAGVFTSPFSVFAEQIVAKTLDTVAITTARAVVYDVLNGDEIAVILPKLLAGAGLGIILGPLVGLGILKLTNSPRVVMTISGVLGGLNAAYTWKYLQETVVPDQRVPFAWSQASPFNFIQLLTESKAMFQLMTTTFLATLSDGRNCMDANTTFQRTELNWSQTQTGMYIASSGVRVMAGGLVGFVLQKCLSMNATVSFSNVANFFVTFAYLLAPSYQITINLLLALGERKRDGVETRISDLGTSMGYGKGQIQAAMFNYRSIANVLAPLVLSAALNYAVKRKQRLNATSLATLHYVIACTFPILTELSWRAVSRKKIKQIDVEAERAAVLKGKKKV